ncbi:MAG: hypothetical protein ACKVU1_02670 [bacterium]
MTAAAEYRRVQGEIRNLVDRFPEVVDAHVARQETTPAYWSHTADLKRARLDLLHVMAFLGDLEAKEQLHAEGESR